LDDSLRNEIQDTLEILSPGELGGKTIQSSQLLDAGAKFPLLAREARQDAGQQVRKPPGASGVEYLGSERLDDYPTDYLAIYRYRYFYVRPTARSLLRTRSPGQDVTVAVENIDRHLGCATERAQHIFDHFSANVLSKALHGGSLRE